MDPSSFKNPAGSLVRTILEQRAFIPSKLPPQLDMYQIQQLLSDADRKIGELQGIGHYLKNPYLLIKPLQRKEAIASSNIEGTFTSLPELLMFESGLEDQPRRNDTREVYNYVRALQEGIESMNELPISNRLIHKLHKRLLLGLPRNRAGYFLPGEYRKEQNFIGKSKDISKSRFNPPPPPTHLECMNELEIFLNKDDMSNLPPLVFNAITHYQFETIHPFPDGNGRVGRLLLPLILKSRGIMDQPLLYMSQYFEDNKDEYVDLMLKVSQNSDWVPWIRFFLKGVIDACDSTIETIRRVRDLQQDYQDRCQQARSSALLLQIVDSLFDKIAVTVPMVKDMTNTSYTAAKNNVEKLVSYKILHESNYVQRPKFYFAQELVDIFEA